MTLFSISLVLFLIMDPIGNVSSFLKMVEKLPPKRQTFIVLREMLFALLFMIFFNYVGEVFFYLLQFSEPAVKIASGLILFLVALQILFPNFGELRGKIPKEEPFIIPFAIPLIAGPSLLATIMLYAHMETSQPMMLKAILIAWGASTIILLMSNIFMKILRPNGLMACEKLMGMVLVLLSVQRFFDGVAQMIS